MKVALALLACVAVSHAAFTGTLQQRTQPLVDQAFFKMQLATGRSDMLNALANFLKPQVAQLIQNVNNHVESAQQAYAELLETVSAITSNPSALLQSLNNLFGGALSGILGNGKLDVSSLVSAVQSHAAALLAQYQTTVDTLLALAHNAASHLTMENLMNWAASQFGLQRGMFSNIWGAITGAVGNAWDTVTDHASAAWDSATTQALDAWNQMYGTATAVAGHTMDTVSAMANAFIDDAQENISSMSAQAALQFQDMMSNWSAQLPGQWDQIQQQVAAIVAADNKPTGRRF